MIPANTGVICYCNGGHNFPVVVKRDGAVAQLENAPGILLGKFDQFSFEAKEIQFQPGDRIVLYTDGVTEATNGSHEMYMEPRLLKFLEGSRPENVNNLVRGVIVDVLQYMGKADQTDDITVLSLEYTGK